MGFLRHSDQCLFPSPQNYFCFTNLFHLVLEIFRFFEKHAQNLNTPQNNSASWELQMGFNLVFNGLKLCIFSQQLCVIMWHKIDQCMCEASHSSLSGVWDVFFPFFVKSEAESDSTFKAWKNFRPCNMQL